jgi:hypothetical protein
VARTAREVMVQHMMAEPPRPSHLNPAYRTPIELDHLILDCLRKEPEDRPATIKDVEQRLQQILDDFVMGRTRAGVWVDQGSLRGRRWLAAAGLALLAASGGFFAWSQGYRPDFQVAEAGALGKVLKKARVTRPGGAATADPATGRAQATSEAATAGEGTRATRTERMTVELIPASARVPVARAKESSESSAEPAAARPLRSPVPAAPRHKPAKLDRNSVLNPFE